MRIGIVIVTHNSEGAIGACLEAASRQEADIVVVDNASRDRTADVVTRFAAVRLIANDENLGFAGAVNQGIRTQLNDLVLLLNPDAFLETSLDDLERAFDDPRIGAAAGKLVDEDGTAQRGFTVRRFPTVASHILEVLGLNRLWPSNPVNRRYRYLDLDLEKPAEVDQPAGAFLMLRRSVWHELGGLDERFHPLWFEDVDYLKRLCSRGFAVRYVPSAVARHLGAHSINTLSHGCRQLYWYDSLLKYALVHFSPAGCKLVCVSVVIGSLLRMVAGAVARLSLKPVATYWEVIRMAAVLMLTGRSEDSRGTAAGSKP
jgi:N-acetylglucosaminyl-diphospho-decaprenol L-rhamnosyltransferase